MDFVQNERLGWTDFEPKGKAFEEDGGFVFSLFFCFFPLSIFFCFVAPRLSILIFSHLVVLFRWF